MCVCRAALCANLKNSKALNVQASMKFAYSDGMQEIVIQRSHSSGSCDCLDAGRVVIIREQNN